ncbi:unnamed protein product [Brassica rapa subsp. trilocularis]
MSCNTNCLQMYISNFLRLRNSSIDCQNSGLARFNMVCSEPFVLNETAKSFRFATKAEHKVSYVPTVNMKKHDQEP